MLQKAGVIKINNKKKEELNILEDFFSDYYKSFHEHLFAENCHLECSESPDFIIKFDNEKIGIEITEAIKEEMMKSEDLEIAISKIMQKYVEEENIKKVIWLSFSNKLDSDINKNKFIKDFTEEFKKYIIARRNDQYASFEEFCESNKDFLICKYLDSGEEPIEETYLMKPGPRIVDGAMIGINYYEKKLNDTINKKIEKLPLYRKKVDKIYLLIITSVELPKDLHFLDFHIDNIEKILNSCIKRKNNFDKIFLYHHSYIEPQIIKSN